VCDGKLWNLQCWLIFFGAYSVEEKLENHGKHMLQVTPGNDVAFH
jgi:hypothetical protein